MKTQLRQLAIGALIALGAATVHASPAQVDTFETCCLAAEWVAPLTQAAAQSDGKTCCLANEWQAEIGEQGPGGADSAVQGGGGEGCCLAAEWQAS